MVALADPVSGESSNLRGVSQNSAERRLWACPTGYVGPAQCASGCCDYGNAWSGGDCPQGLDCTCYKWSCRRLEEEDSSHATSLEPEIFLVRDGDDVDMPAHVQEWINASGAANE